MDMHAFYSLLERPLPEQVQVRRPEGYTQYAVYPEMYLLAGTRARARIGAWPCIIGIRSIGSSLAACVATALGTGPSVSLRPVGHPFARRLALDDALARSLAENAERRTYAVVDEGPGLSGSSFGCVADWLEAHGVPEARIHFFPSHGGDIGPRGNPRHRERWRRAPRHVATFEDLFRRRPAHPDHIARWMADVTGPPEGPCEDLGGGAWRRMSFDSEADWPPSLTWRERRKFLFRARGRHWLLRFAGLGRHGFALFERARALSEARLVPPVSGYRHGYTVEPWMGDHTPLPHAPRARQDLPGAVIRHLTHLARAFPAAGTPGAGPPRLLEMAVHNAGACLGEEHAREVLGRWTPYLSELSAHHVPIRSDNRMHAWEWLVGPDGRILKTDALDHHAGHDLVGAQDIAWDMAGARVELEFSDAQYERLIAAIAGGAHMHRPRARLAFYELAYLAFQWALHAMGRDAPGPDDGEAPRLDAACLRYRARLQRCIEDPAA